MDINTEEVLNTPEKAIIRAYNELRDNYTKMGALKFYELYNPMPNSMKIKMARYILSEPYRGFAAINDGVVGWNTLPIHSIRPLRQTVQDIINTSGTKMGEKQLRDFNWMLKRLTDMDMKDFAGLAELNNSLTDNPYEMQKTVDMLYDDFAANMGNFADRTPVKDGYRLDLTPIEGKACYLSEYLKLSWATDFNWDTIMSNIDSIYNNLVSEKGELQAKVHMSEILRRIFSHDLFRRMITPNMSPENVDKLQRYMGKDLEEYLESELTTSPISSFTLECYSDPQVLITTMYENAENDRTLGNINDDIKMHNLCIEKAILDIKAAYLYNDYIAETDTINENVDETFNEAMIKRKLDMVTERLNEIDAMFEYKEDGSPSKVLQRHNGSGIRETQVKDTTVGSSSNVRRSASSAKGSLEYDDDTDEDDDDGRPDVSTMSDAELDAYLKKPNESGARKIQNAALDADIKAKKNVAEWRQRSQDSRNAIKAVSKVPKNVTDAINKQIHEMDDMDDERRKEYIIKPGVRKRYWKALKIACAHFLVFKIHPICNVILLIAGKLSKDKNQRIRNELVLELDTEIRVCEQKIDDAKAVGDTKAVYKLMRLKDKLAQEKTRVSTNSKVI